MAKARTIRDEWPLPDEALLVRLLFDAYLDGVALDRARLLADARLNFTHFGYYGLSLWGVSAAWPLDRVLEVKSSASRHVALYRAGGLRDRGLGIVPSGKAPHYDTSSGLVYGESFGSLQVVAPGAEDLVDRFVSTTYTVIANRFFVGQLG